MKKTVSRVCIAIRLLVDIIQDLELTKTEQKELYKVIKKQLEISNGNGDIDD